MNLKEVLKILISRFQNKGIDFVLSGGLALSTMGIFRKLTDEERLEMIEDARNISRSKVFQAARITTQKGSLDDYIDFLSQNIEWVKVVPTKRITTNYKL